MIKKKIINHLDFNCNLIAVEFRTSFLDITIKRVFVDVI